jgi:signal-transduction protein with cAMP-binding, CBS, and nucleotidyltransferase domain
MRCGMRTTVREIIVPFKEGLPLSPSVSIGDKITRAVELMLTNNLGHIAVIRGGHPIGMVRLEDAFKKLGLRRAREEKAI